MRLPTTPLALTLILFLSIVGPLAPPAAAQQGDHAVTGVVQSDEGVPLAGVHVSGWTGADDRSAHWSDDAITAEDGTFTLRLGAGRGYVSIWYDAWRVNDGRDIHVEGDLPGVDFTLRTPPPKTAIVAGVVTDADGNPVADARVDVWRTCCDERHYAYATGGGSAETDAATTEERTANATTADEPESSSPSEPTVAPAPYPYYHHDSGASTTTDETGRYEVALYPGLHQVTVNAKGFTQGVLRVEAVENATVAADVTLEKIPASDAVVRGRVVDAETGAPLEGAWVSLTNQEWGGRYASAQTDATGAFELKTIPGWVQVSVHYNGPPVKAVPAPLHEGDEPAPASLAMPVQPAGYYSYVKSFRAESGETPLAVQLERKPEPSVVLLGYVVDPEAETGIPNAQVSFWNQDTGDWGSAITDATGSYKIRVRPGHYTVNAWAEGYLGSADMLAIAEDATTKRFDLFMPKGTPKYAPCYEGDDGCPYYSYEYARAEPMMVDEDAKREGMTASTPPPSPTPAPMMAGGGEASSRPATAANSGPATFHGEGGGLPPYTPESETEEPGDVDGATATPGPADARDDASGATRANENVPGLGIVAALGALAVLALALRRRS